MREVTAGRTLVKSPPELWAVCSDADSLAQHLEAFGEIRITRLEPETTVAWEGERASGTVRIEPSGWGTKVTVTAATESVSAPEPPVVAPESASAPEPPVGAPEHVAPEPEPTRRPRLLARLFGGARAPLSKPIVGEALVPEPDAVVAAPDPVEVAPEPLVAPQPQAVQADQPAVDAATALEAALDSLGQAHKRPFSR